MTKNIIKQTLVVLFCVFAVSAQITKGPETIATSCPAGTCCSENTIVVTGSASV